MFSQKLFESIPTMTSSEMSSSQLKPHQPPPSPPLEVKFHIFSNEYSQSSPEMHYDSLAILQSPHPN